MDHILHQKNFLAISIVRLFTYFSIHLESKHVVTFPVKLRFGILIPWVCWPWIVSMKLSQAI